MIDYALVLLFFSYFPSFSSFPLEVGLFIAAKGFGERCKVPGTFGAFYP